jgi:hypothetical protein
LRSEAAPDSGRRRALKEEAPSPDPVYRTN